MRPSARILGASVGLLVLILIGAGCHTATPASFEHDESSTVLVLAPKGSGNLAVAPSAAFSAGSDASEAVDNSPTGGASRTLSRLQGSPAPATATYTATAETDYYVDVAKPVAGTVYVSNTLNAGPRAVESGQFQVELYVDGQFGGGSQFDHNPASSGAKWNPVPVYFRPEVRHIPAGSTVEVRISSISSLLDFQVGTGGAMQSQFHVPFFPFDPLSGALFLEGGKLVASLSEDNATSQEGVRMFMEDPDFQELPPGLYIVQAEASEERGSLHLALVPAALIGLVGLIGRSPRKILAVSLVATMVLAGCAGKGDAKEDQLPENPFQPKVNSTVEDNQGDDAAKQREQNVGSLEGVVKDHVGIPLEAAHVSLLATNKFASTDAQGRFLIKDIPAGAYTMRVDAEDMDSLERDVEVFVAKTTMLSIQMAPPATAQADALAHHHDQWGGKDRVRWMDAVAFTPDGSSIATVAVDTPIVTACTPHRGTGTSDHYGTVTPLCEYAVPIDFSKPVIPGTGTVEVVLDWDTGGIGAPATLGLSYTNHVQGTSKYQMYMPRAPGEPFYIQVYPNEADPGHQRFTNWQLSVVTTQPDAYSPWEMPAIFPQISVETFIHKSIVPFEPKHTDRWGEATEFLLADGTARRTFSCICDSSSANVGVEDGGWWSYSSATWTPLKGSWVPPGTSHIEGKLVSSPYTASGVAAPAPPHIEYGLAYKPATLPSGHARGNLVVVEGMKAVSDGYEFKIVPTAEELDQWYQGSSQWQFFLLVRSNVHPYSTHGMTLEAHAIKDPSWEGIG